MMKTKMRKNIETAIKKARKNQAMTCTSPTLEVKKMMFTKKRIAVRNVQHQWITRHAPYRDATTKSARSKTCVSTYVVIKKKAARRFAIKK